AHLLDPRPDPAAPEPPGSEPLRPRIDLRFGGQCRPRFDARLAVTTMTGLRLLAITAVAGDHQIGALMIQPYDIDPRGTITLDHYVALGRPAVTVDLHGSAGERWVSWGPRTDPADPSSPVAG